MVLTSSLDTGVTFTVNFASMAKYVIQQVNVPTASTPIYPNYRFGYNAIEKVDEVAGIGNHYTAKFGEYDPRDVKRWNLDPKSDPSFSPYAVFGNNPIQFSDINLDTPSTYRMATSSRTISVQTNVTEKAGMVDGHAWIKIVNLKDSHTATYSLWGNRDEKEFLKNEEADYPAYTNRTLYISEEDYKKFYDFCQDLENVDWTITNTCAGFSSEAWKTTTGESLNSSNVFGWTIPAILAGSITQKNGGKHTNVDKAVTDKNSSANSSAESSNSNSSSSSGSNGSGSGSSTSSSSSGSFGANDSGSSGSSVTPSVGPGGARKSK